MEANLFTIISAFLWRFLFSSSCDKVEIIWLLFSSTTLLTFVLVSSVGRISMRLPLSRILAWDKMSWDYIKKVDSFNHIMILIHMFIAWLKLLNYLIIRIWIGSLLLIRNNDIFIWRVFNQSRSKFWNEPEISHQEDGW